jgi:uncharacterized oligopeptide transporter (OPT) family protein
MSGHGDTIGASDPTSMSAPSSVSDASSSRAGTDSASGTGHLTARALVTGAVLGSILAAGNVYTGLKCATIDGGSITASLLGFGLFATFGRFLGGRLSAHEINMVQATASTAGVISFVGGLMGPIPALALMGHALPAWMMATWALALGFLGSFLGLALRERLIEVERLPFPTGAATAEVIETVVGNAEEAARRTKLLVLSAPLAAFVTWLRDGSRALLPQSLTPRFSVLGISSESLNLGIGLSPLLMATGMLMGLHAATSFVLGSAIDWLVVGPRLVRAGLAEGTYTSIVAWAIWPSVGLLAASTLLPLCFEVRSFWRAFRDLQALSRAKVPALTVAVVAAIAAILLVGGHAFGLAPWEGLLLVSVTVVFGAISGRSAGETDMAPVGSLGTLAQVFFARGAVHSVGAGSAVSGATSQVAQSLWSFKATHRLRGSARATLYGQWLGLVVGAAVGVPAYLVIIKAYGLATPALPAVSALSFRATAEALRGGLAQLPPLAPTALCVGTAIGAAAVLVGRIRPSLMRILPSPVAMAIGFISPFSLTAAAFVGALALVLVKRWRGVSDGAATAIASGAMAGEALMGVAIALAAAFFGR